MSFTDAEQANYILKNKQKAQISQIFFCETALKVLQLAYCQAEYTACC